MQLVTPLARGWRLISRRRTRALVITAPRGHGWADDPWNGSDPLSLPRLSGACGPESSTSLTVYTRA